MNLRLAYWRLQPINIFCWLTLSGAFEKRDAVDQEGEQKALQEAQMVGII
jgi:hypothetical protein